MPEKIWLIYLTPIVIMLIAYGLALLYSKIWKDFEL